ncbi:MAG: PQQ-dependent sugar dehydrogenase [Bacteroidota bacterium]
MCESSDAGLCIDHAYERRWHRVRKYASGIRNTVGLAWHPTSNNLWFTDNGRDRLGDDIPPCELNTATKKGQHFGYPYCHAGTIKDPEFGNKRPLLRFREARTKSWCTRGTTWFEIYTGKQFPAEYRNQVIICEHGSWDRNKMNGYKLSLVKVDAKGKSLGYETFASGWLNEETQKAWGRLLWILYS